MSSTSKSTRKRPRPPSAASLPIIKEGRQTRTSLKASTNTLNLLPEPTRKRKPKSPTLPVDLFTPPPSKKFPWREVRLNEESAINKKYQANLPNLQIKANALNVYPQNTAMTINELLRNTSNPNLNPATSKSNHKTKNMTKKEVNNNFKRNINNLSLRKKLQTRREMNRYLTMNVSKPNPPLGRLIEGHLKENAPAAAPKNNNTKRNRQNNNNTGPSSKRPRPNNKTRRARKH
jgi:hypothetical protein